MNNKDFKPDSEEYIEPVLTDLKRIDPNQENSLLREIQNGVKNLESFRNRLQKDNIRSKIHLKIIILANFTQLALFVVLSLIFLIQTSDLYFLIFLLISISIIILSFIILRHYYKINKIFPVLFNIKFFKAFNLDIILKPLSILETSIYKIKSEIEAIPKKLDNDFDKLLYKSNMAQMIALNKQYMFFDNLRNSSEIRLEFLNKGYAYILELKRILENYQISLNEIEYHLILEDLDKEINGRDYNKFFNKIAQRVANLTTLDDDVLKLLYYTHYGLNNKEIWNKVQKSDNKLENLSKNLVKSYFFQNNKIIVEDLSFILSKIRDFQLNIIKSFTNLFNSFSFKIEKIAEYLELFKIHIDPRIMFIEILNENRNIENNFDISLAILKEIISLKNKEINDNSSKYNEHFLKILGFLIGRDYFTEIFRQYCEKIAQDKELTIILWKILKFFENNSKAFIFEYQMTNTSLIQFIQDKIKDDYNIKIENHIISVFQENLLNGIIILDEIRLFSEFYRNMKEGSDIIENIFSKFGDIDFKYLLNAVFSKFISNNHFLKIFSSVTTQNYTPFLLTFDNVQSYVDEILNELQNKRLIYWTQYTRSTRIGIASKEYRDLKTLRNKIEEEIDRRLVKDMPQDDYESKFDYVLNRMWDAVMESKRTDDKNYEILEKIYYDSIKIKDYNQRKLLFDSLTKFLDYNKHPGAKNLIEDFLKPFHIMIYQLLSDDDGIHRIESSEKYSPLSKIKEQYARKIEDKRTMNVGISMDKDFKDINFYQVFEKTLETASFEDLLLSEFEIFSEIKSKIAKPEKVSPKLKNIVELSFGETGTSNFLKKEISGITNLKELSDKISQKIRLKTDWNREINKKNIMNIEAILGEYIIKLTDFWEAQIPKKIRDEIPLLEQLFIKRKEMSRRIFHYLLYIKLVISKELFLTDLTSSKEKAEKIWEKLQSFLGTELLSKLKKDLDFEELIIRTIQLIETFMEYPIYRMVRKAEYQLDITKLENHFQYRFYEHYRRFFDHKITKEPEVQDNRMDLLLKNYPIEIKMRKKEDKNWKEFIDRWLGQISQYCTTRNADIGLLIIYDNVENYDPDNFLIDFFDFKEGYVLNEEERKDIKKPKIIIIRVPNFIVTPRDKKKRII